MSSITYHYGSKDGLYLAAADYIAERINEKMAPAIEAGGLPDGLVADEARARIHVIMEHFAEMMASPISASWSLFIVREQMNPTEAFERIYGGLMCKMLATLIELVCIATARRDARTSQVAVITLMGQVVTLRASRATVLKLLDKTELDATAIDVLKQRIAANTDAILDRLIAERQELP